MSVVLSRRQLVAGAGGLLLSGCDRVHDSAAARGMVGAAEALTMRAQRLLASPDRLAREFARSEIARDFRVNGNKSGSDPVWTAQAANGFADYRLQIDGLVERPLALGLADLRAMPARTQVTRHDCVEGWSAIAQWTGTPLALVLRAAGLAARARYLVFHCGDDFRGHAYYESIDLVDAFHPQTILAWAMNDAALPIAHGAPVRLRVERQLGYKQAKFVMRIEAVASLAGIGGGKGGYWEDVAGYQWYAGI